MINTQSHEYENLINRVTTLYKAGAKGADFEKLQQKAVTLLNFEIQKGVHKRECQRQLDKLNDKQKELVEQMEQELIEIEAHLQI